MVSISDLSLVLILKSPRMIDSPLLVICSSIMLAKPFINARTFMSGGQ